MAIISPVYPSNNGSIIAFEATTPTGDEVPWLGSAVLVEFSNEEGFAVTISFAPTIARKKVPGVGFVNVPTTSYVISPGEEAVFLFDPAFTSAYVNESMRIPISYANGSVKLKIRAIALDSIPSPRHSFVNNFAKTWMARNIAQPSKPDGALLDAYFNEIEAGGAFTLFDAGYICAPPHHEQAAVVNVIQAKYDGYLINGAKVTLRRGLSGDGASSSMDTLMKFGDVGLKHVLNSNGVIIAIIDDQANTPQASHHFGSGSFRLGRNSGAFKDITGRSHQGSSSTFFSHPNGGGPNIFGMERVDATTVKTYQLGVGLVNTITVASTAANTESFRIAAAGAGGFGKGTIGMVLSGGQFGLAGFTPNAQAMYNYLHNPLIGAM